MAEVIVIAGPARCGKTRAQLEAYRQAIAAGPPGSALWLAPNRRSAAEIRGSLLNGQLQACLAPQVYTFEQFAESALALSSQPVRRITPLMKRQIVGDVVDRFAEDGKLQHCGPIASTAGVVDLFSGFIRELKQLEIWPEEFERACKPGKLRPKDREVLAVYYEYQRILNEHRLYDAEGRFWWAHQQMHDGQGRPCERARLVIADGFADFTHSQHEILQNLASRVDRLTITLPLDRGEVRRDLFAKSARTLEQLRTRHPDLQVRHIEPESTSADWPAMFHVERHLFGDPRSAVRAKSTDGLEIIAASGQLGEIEQIASRIKQLLAGDHPQARPGEVLVVFRSLAEVAPLVREIFTERGIPFALEAGDPLAQAPAVCALINVLRLASEDWPYRRLLAVLGSNYFAPAWPEWSQAAAMDTEHIIRGLQIPVGRAALLDGVRRYARSANGKAIDDPEDRPRLQLLRKRAASALPVLERFARCLDELPKKETVANWILKLKTLVQAIGLLPPSANNDECDDDRSAWETLIDGLKQSDRLGRWIGQSSAELNRNEILQRISDIANETSLQECADESGRVRVISAAAARGLRVDYVFLAGLSEKAFPQPDRGSAVYSEGEYQRLSGQGLRLPMRAERGQDEMLLFYEMVTAAKKRLYLSYPAIDEAAQPLSPSPYLVELERACGIGSIVRHEVPDLSPVPQHQPCGPAERRVRAMADALENKVEPLANLLSEGTSANAAENILAGVDVIHQRGPGDGFGAFEGILPSDAARRVMADQFGPQQCWSASQLEQFAHCPYQFFMGRILGLEPLPDLVLEVDYMVRGRILHETLASMHRTLNETLGQPCSLSSQDGAKVQELYAKTLGDLIGRLHVYNPLDTALREVDRRLLTEWAKLYFTQHQLYDQAWKDCDLPPAPAHFEVSFGSERGLDRADPLSTTEPFVIEHDGESIKLSGRIDRIDVGGVGGQTVFNILDYKTGSAGRLTRESIEAGLALQLPLYAIVAQELLLTRESAVPWRVGYWFVKTHGYKEKDGLKLYESSGGGVRPSDEWQSLRQAILDRVVSLVRAVRSAQFPVLSADDQCTSRCDFRTVCRVGQARALEKTWQAPSQPAT